MGTSMCVPRERRDDRPVAYFGVPVSILVVYERRAVSQSTNYISGVPVLLQDIAFYWDTEQAKNYTTADKNGGRSPSAVSPDSIWIASAEKAINDSAKKCKLLLPDKHVRVAKKKSSPAGKSSGKRASRVFEKAFRSLFAKTPLRAPHFVALLTLFLRKLPEPLLPSLFVRQMEEVLSNGNMSQTAMSQTLQKLDRQLVNSNYTAEHATFQYLKQLVQRHRAELIAAEVEILFHSMLRESNECVVEFMMHQVRPLVNPVIPVSVREASGGCNSGEGNSSGTGRTSRRNTASVSPEGNENNASNAGSVLHSSHLSHHNEVEENVADDKCTPPQSEESVFSICGDSSRTSGDIQEEVKRAEGELDDDEKGIATPIRRGPTTTATTTTTSDAVATAEASYGTGVDPPLTTMYCTYSTDPPGSAAGGEDFSNRSIDSCIRNENNVDEEPDHHDTNSENAKKQNNSCSKMRHVTPELDINVAGEVLRRPGDGEHSQGLPVLGDAKKYSKKGHTFHTEEEKSARLSKTGKADVGSGVVACKQSMIKKNKQHGTQDSKIHLTAAVDDDDDDSDDNVMGEYEDKKKDGNVDRSKFIKMVDGTGNCTELDEHTVLPDGNFSTRWFPKRNSFHHDRYVALIKNGKEQIRRVPGPLEAYLSHGQRTRLEATSSSRSIQPILNLFPYRGNEAQSNVKGGRCFASEHPRHAALLLAKQIFLGEEYLPPTRLQVDYKVSELVPSPDAKNTNDDKSKASSFFRFSESEQMPSAITVGEPVPLISEEKACDLPQREKQLPFHLQLSPSNEEQLHNPVIQSLLTKLEELSAQCNSLALLVNGKMTTTPEPHKDQMMIPKQVEEEILLLRDAVRQMAECHSATVGDVLKLQQQLESVLAEGHRWWNDAIGAKEAALELQHRCARIETAQLEGKQQVQYVSAELKDLAYKLESGEKENLNLKVEIAALQRQGLLLREKLLSSS